MVKSKLDEAALERIYDAMADALDRVGEDREPVFLAKLALALAALSGDERAVLDAIAVAERDLDA